MLVSGVLTVSIKEPDTRYQLIVRLLCDAEGFAEKHVGIAREIVDRGLSLPLATATTPKDQLIRIRANTDPAKGYPWMRGPEVLHIIVSPALMHSSLINA